MEPELQSNNLLITERISKRIKLLERGDIVIAKSPIEPKIMVCKRIVGNYNNLDFFLNQKSIKNCITRSFDDFRSARR